MIKDRALKATALQYLASKRYFSQLEVVVLPQVSTTSSNSRKAAPLTDVDVLGLIPDDLETFRTLLIDCKTLKSQSPVGRALWLRGLMDELNARRGLCVLRGDRIQSDHRLSASRLNVLLITEDEFAQYIQATGGQSNGTNANAAEIDLWEAFLEIGSRFQRLAPLVEFSSSQFWQPREPAATCRRTLALLRKLRGELDPAKPEHIAVVSNMAALFLICVSQIAMNVFTSYLQPRVMGELSEALLVLLYGGKETYDALNALRRLVKVSGETGDELALPEWEVFVQFIREVLEAPTELNKAPLIMREIAWTYLKSGASYSFLDTLLAESPRAAKYALLGTEYFCKAAKLPPEFGAGLSSCILDHQVPPK